MAFYFGNPLSIFLDDPTYCELSPFQFQKLRELPSFKAFIDAIKKGNFKDKEKLQLGVSLLKDDHALFKWALERAKDLLDYKRGYSVCLDILYKMQSLYNSRELQYSLFELHSIGLEEDLGKSAHTNTLVFLLKKQDLKRLCAFTHDILNLIETEQVTEIFADFVKESTEFLQSINDEESEQESEQESNSEQENKSDLENDLNHTLLKFQSQMKNKRKSLVSSRTKIIDISTDKTKIQKNMLIIKTIYEKLFEKHLFNYTKLHLYELSYFLDKSRLIRKTFMADPRGVIQSALEYPSNYLGCTCCQDNLGQDMLDCTVMYRLYLESGRLINLQDWYEAFKSVVGMEDGADVCQSRFLRGVKELEFIGFIRSTNRKKDNVLKLVFSK
jgi:origin recognition complex subunit 3